MRRKFHASTRCNLVNAAAQYFRSDFTSRACRQNAGRTIAILCGFCGPRSVACAVDQRFDFDLVRGGLE
jgi:hypothetical protein